MKFKKYLQNCLKAISITSSLLDFTYILYCYLPNGAFQEQLFKLLKTWRRCQGLKSNSLTTKLHMFLTINVLKDVRVLIGC